jgi:hypothetical protein
MLCVSDKTIIIEHLVLATLRLNASYKNLIVIRHLNTLVLPILRISSEDDNY